MPINKVTKNGTLIGFRWGKSGKLYKNRTYGREGARLLARRQAKAIYASGYGNKKRSKPKEHRRRLNSGRKITINKGVKKKVKRKMYAPKVRQEAAARINRTRQLLSLNSEEFRKQKERLVPDLSFLDKEKISSKIDYIRKDTAQKNQTIDFLKKKFSLENI